MPNLQIVDFYTLDYKNENVLSSYALPQTYFTFFPKTSSYEYSKILWDFGDGTISEDISAKKYYRNPGEYKVSLVIYDCESNANVSTYTKTLSIQDFIPHTFTINFEDASWNNTIQIKNGVIGGPFIINAYTPINKKAVDIYYNVTNNTDSAYYYDINGNKYAHLLENYCLFDKIWNNSIKNYQFSEIDKISLDYDNLYARIKNNTIQNCSKTDEGSFLVGLSATKDVFYKDDVIGTAVIDFFYDKTKIFQNDKNPFVNNLKISLSAQIVENDDVEKLSITSNGLDGEYYGIKSFNFSKIKFSNIEIPFTIRVKDLSGFSVKNFNDFTFNDVGVSVLSSGYEIPSDYYTITQLSSYPGSVVGSILFNIDTKLEYVRLSAYSIQTNDRGSTFTMDGVSNTFNLYPQNYLYFEKKNEDYDFTEMFKSLRFQEFLIDKDVLFDDFIGSIFGTIDSDFNTLGKKIHEKITNFTENHKDIDRCETNSLLSEIKMINGDNLSYDRSLLLSPDRLRRFIDLGSIEKNKLFGYENKFKENFDIKGHTSKETYGRNIGNEINTDTYLISAGVPIVALEMFGNTYTLLNTYQPVEYVGSNTYKLSSYSSDWGWPLVLPATFSYSDFPKYYKFFEYVLEYDGTIKDNTLLYDENLEYLVPSDLLTEDEEPLLDDLLDIIEPNGDYYRERYSKDFIFTNNIMDTLYQSLSLIK